MITGKDIQEVIKDMKTNGSTNIGQLIAVLDLYGIKHAEKNVRISKKNPVQSDFSILTLHMNAGYTHWVLYYYGKYYDPEFGLLDNCHPEGRITSFFTIYEG
ncbi:MAG: hypothetical protein K0S41_2347 [Anaerocolumna sp.]|jgi:hypothetical protein|nr:hypothetical protein [Anaerocolumna sp.]